MTEEEKKHVSALVAGGKHLFIEASAGSGKTTRLVALILEIILQKKARISEILCVTFTEKAASELKARIFASLSGEKSKEASEALRDFSLNAIGTIHGFCRAALKDLPGRLGDDTLEANADETELFEEAREFVFRQEWPALGAERLAAFLSALDFGKRDQITRKRALDTELKQKCLYLFAASETRIVPEPGEADALSDAVEFKAWTMSKIVAKMRELSEGRNLMTFSGMITGMAGALDDAAFAEKIRSKYGFALIDEFQDTDALQWRIFKTLFLNTKTRLMVVGDPKQSIYKFRGADVFVYLAAQEEMLRAGAVSDLLPANHRSTPELLRTLDTIFTAPKVTAVWQAAAISYPIPQPARASAPETGMQFFHRPRHNAGTAEDFAHIALNEIRATRQKHPDWSVAVIAFRHRALATFARIFRDAGMEFAYYRQKPDFHRLEIIHLKILLQSFSLAPDEGFALASKTIFLKAEKDPVEYYHRLARNIADGKILVFMQTLAQNLNPIQMITAFAPDVTVYHGWRVLMQSLIALCGVKIFDLETLRLTLHELEETPGDDEHQGDMLRSTTAVTLLTVASAKGLDWDMVVLADGVTDKLWRSFPFFHDQNGNAVVTCDEGAFDRSSDKMMPIEHEARLTQLNLLYVALTRARNRFVGVIAPPYQGRDPGATAYFLSDWAESAGAPVADLDEALAQIKEIDQSEKTTEPPREVAHGTIPDRIRERTSFSRLVTAEFSETVFIEDILPRGSGVGEILHSILENLDFSAYRRGSIPASAKFIADLLPLLGTIRRDGKDITQPVAERIFEIVTACANAALPLRAGNGSVSLAELPPENLWREMPFWSAAATHRILREDVRGETQRSMHGFMDLVFTVDERDYYILDYKSNSLNNITPENIDGYTREHYGLQAEIYSEALAAYLDKNYPGENRRVAGCYFLFLRYLKAGDSEGVHFTETKHA